MFKYGNQFQEFYVGPEHEVAGVYFSSSPVDKGTNSLPNSVLADALLTSVANELRLALHKSGIILPLATFFGAIGEGPLQFLDCTKRLC